MFKKHGLNITIECNLRITNFLDVGFDLRIRRYYPYTKTNGEFIHKKSNDPTFITKKIPAIISKRISNISCDKESFDKAAPEYNNALKNSGLNGNIKFTPPPPKRRKRSINDSSIHRLAPT